MRFLDEKVEKYRFEAGSAYEYDEKKKAYVFIGKLNGKTKKQFIKDYEEGLLYEDEKDPEVAETQEFAEVEMEVAEPTKITDKDGSVVVVTPGDTVTIKSESIKRL